MGILVNFSPSYMEIERYFYDPETNNVLTYTGEVLKPNILLDAAGC